MPDHSKSLSDIFFSHRGKVSDKWSSYLPIYERSFERFRKGPVKLLEIGIQNGGSLEIYKEYFPADSLFIGCDINPDCAKLRYESGIHFVLGDCCASQTRDAIVAISPSFDIIIDDGSHRSSDIIAAFLTYLPMLTEGGSFIIEDLHASYWQQWEGGLFFTLSSMSFLKLLADTINSEHWANGKTASDLIRNEFPRYADLVAAAKIDEIYSIQFLNSVCVVEKCSTINRPGLGNRIVTGTDASVHPSAPASNGSSFEAPDQRGNPYSVFI